MPETAPLSLARSSFAEAWLTNFDEPDRPTAELLLRSISVVGETAFRAEMKHLLQEVSARLAPLTVGALPLQAIPAYLPSTGFYTDQAQLTPSGSELIVENILLKSKRKTKFMVYPSVATLRIRKVDVVLLVTDVLATGSELEKFVDFLHRNPTIRSWHSSRHIRFEVAAHTLSDLAAIRIAKDKRITDVHVAKMDRTFDRAAWTTSERAEIESLCTRYAADPDLALGWGGARSLVAFGHTVGNGLPGIVLQSRGPSGGVWNSLLAAGRDYGFEPADEVGSSGYRPPFDMGLVLDAMRDEGSARSLQKQERTAIDLGGGSMDEATLAKLLVAVRLGFRDDRQLMRVTDLSAEEVRHARATAVDLGLLSQAVGVTKQGASFIRRRGRGRAFQISELPSGAATPYYPQHLR